MVDKGIPALIAQTGALRGQRWGLTKARFVIGRDAGCDLIIPDKTVSRRHACLCFQGEQWFLEDTSKNGVHLNDRPVTAPTPVHDGDTISVARAVRMLFVGSDATVPLSLESQALRRLRIDTQARRVWVGTEEIDLPLSLPQYRLLELLYSRGGQVSTRDTVVNAVWPDAHGEGVSEQSIDALVRRLRDRLAEVDPDHQYVVTVRGHGFRLDNPWRV